ncbi:MAG: AEC family transporter [Elusimicrobiota bacterium]
MDNSIILIILIILIGYFYAYFDKKDYLEYGINKYLYYIALPATIFLKTVSINIKIITLNFVMLNIAPIIIVFLVVHLLYKTDIIKHNFARTLIITSTLGNLVYLGFAVVSKKLGEGAIGIAAIVSGIQNIVIFTFGIFIMNIICPYNKCSKIAISKTLKNPLLISSITGIIGAIIGVELPDIIEDIFKEISNSTTTLALFSIGVGLYGEKVYTANIKKILIISFFKMFLLPLFAFIWIYFSNEGGIQYEVSLIEYMMPQAVASYIVAKELDLETNVVAQSIVFTTILYFILLPFYVSAIKLLF